MAPSMRERAGSESHVVCDKTAVYDRWFQYADQDRDGRVTGKDAVGFFERSDLSREVLFKVSRQLCMHASIAEAPCTAYMHAAASSCRVGACATCLAASAPAARALLTWHLVHTHAGVGDGKQQQDRLPGQGGVPQGHGHHLARPKGVLAVTTSRAAQPGVPCTRLAVLLWEGMGAGNAALLCLVNTACSRLMSSQVGSQPARKIGRQAGRCT